MVDDQAEHGQPAALGELRGGRGEREGVRATGHRDRDPGRATGIVKQRTHRPPNIVKIAHCPASPGLIVVVTLNRWLPDPYVPGVELRSVPLGCGWEHRGSGKL
ncbi:hypothetical protein GCM10027436_29360 [Actinophytocola sediminis]